jgi:hypothetical protein
VASSGLSPILALRATTRATTDTGGISRTYARNGPRQSILGRAAHCQ